MPIALAKADKKILAKHRNVVSGLRKLIKKENIIFDDVGRMVFSSDALQTYSQLPLVVVFPETTKEVAAVLKYCSENGLKVIPRGAGTSLTGAALPSEDAVLVCLSKMNEILKISYDDRTVKAQAGATNQSVTDAVSSEGFFYAPDPESQAAATIGGNIATNAGGLWSIKYGVTANNLLGLTLVTMNGEVLQIGGNYLDAMEYDLLSLVCSSEGQLGIVTEATVRILPKKERARPVLVGFASVHAAIECAGSILQTGVMPVALELMDKSAIQLSEEFAPSGYPENAEAVLIVEVDGYQVELDRYLSDINEATRSHEPIIVRISESEEERTELWKGRKALEKAISKISDCYKLDGTIPPGMLPEVLEQVSAISKGYNLRAVNTYHAGDGTLYTFLLYDANNPEEVGRVEAAGAEVLKLCVGAGGGLSGEHGIGLEKRDVMGEQFTQMELKQQMRIKDAFDPDWLLNPGKVFPLEMHR